MDIILQELKTKINLSEEVYQPLKLILQTENNQVIFQNFKKLLALKDLNNANNLTETFNYHIALLTLYNFNFHKDFKNPLINLLKASKTIQLNSTEENNKKSIFDKIIEEYLDVIDLSIESENIDYLRAKLLSFINYFDLLKSLNYAENEKIKFNYYKSFKSILKEMESHLKKINDDIFQLLIMFFKYLNLFYKQNPFYNVDQELIDLLYNQLFMHYENLKQVQFCKDYEFNLANCYFQIAFMKIKKNTTEQNSSNQIQEYIKKGKALFSKFSSDAFKVLLYFKAFILNVDREAYLFECLKSYDKKLKVDNVDENTAAEFDFLNFIRENYFIKNSEKGSDTEINVNRSNFLDFYNGFLTNDLKLNLTALINEIFLSIVIKSNIKSFSGNTDNEVNDIKSLVYTFIVKENIIEKVFFKMEKDKNYFNIMDDYYFFIVEAIYFNDSLKEKIENLCYRYLKNIIDKNYKLMVIEVKLFKFLNLQKEENVALVKDFFKFIFRKNFDKRNLPLINEYIKIMCELFFRNSELLESQRGLNTKNSKKEIEQNNLIAEYKVLEDKYNKFLEVFCEPFFDYVQKVDGKSLKHFKNIFVNLEKFNKNLFALIVSEFHKKYFTSNLTQDSATDFASISQNYIIFITLIKPFKSQKKSIKIVGDGKNKLLKFNFEIFKDYKEVNFSLNMSEINNLVKSLDRYLVIYLLEFLIGMECEENVFEIIYSLIKYNLKSNYVEYKSSVMKTLTVYFNGYIEKLNRLLSLKEKKSEGKNKNVPQYKPEEKLFMEKSLRNFNQLLSFLSENIYDRPVENLLCFLEILKLIVSNFQPSFSHLDKVDNKISEGENNIFYLNAFKKSFEDFVFNKGLAFSLISLLRQSWSLVRFTSFSILKNNNFTKIILTEKEALTEEILRNVNSLRQMDAEGCVNLFLLLIHHLKTEFFEFFLQKLSNKNKIDLNSDNANNLTAVKTLPNSNSNSFEVLNSILTKFIEIINSKRAGYFNFINHSNKNNSSANSDLVNSESYIHSYFIFIRTTLEEIKESPDIFNDKTDLKIEQIYNFVLLLNSFSDLVLSLNSEFKVLLVNNGVAEFSISGEGENECFESEDKKLISLWISTKYSLESLNLCYDIINNFYKVLPKNEKFENILKNIQADITQIIDLMIDYKHMGAICGLNDALLSACRILNRSEEEFKSYRDTTFNFLKEFLDKKLIKEELSTILRRSAGIPFIITSLIKSYLSNDKFSTFSHNKVVVILKSSIESLLNSYIKYQLSNPDTAVHCLNILRILVDDTMLKPFAKDFNDYIILNIIDGLGGDNWIIKNACMLLFSKLIKNNFILDSAVAKGIPSFVEYFINKNILKNKIFEILKKEAEKPNSDCNDCLILLISFFSKLKPSKPSEINEADLLKFLEVLFKLESKNNKVFRKTLGKVILNFYGENQFMCYERVISFFANMQKTFEGLKGLNSNVIKEKVNLNSLDFYLNLLKELQITENFTQLSKGAISTNNANVMAEEKIDESQKNTYLRKIGNKSNFDSVKLNNLNLFIADLDSVLKAIFASIDEIVSEDFKNHKSSNSNSMEYLLNYLNTKEKKNKNFIYAVLLLVKKFSKLTLKSNRLCKLNKKGSLLTEINLSLKHSFFSDSDKNEHLFFGKLERSGEAELFFDFNHMDKILRSNIKNPFFYKSLRNLFQLYDDSHSAPSCEANKSSRFFKITNFDLNKVDFKNQELVLFLLKNYPYFILDKGSIYEKVLYCFEIFNNKNSDNSTEGKLAEINVNIFSRVLDFFNENLKSIEISLDSSLNLIMKMLKFLEENINVTRLIKSILISISKLMKKTLSFKTEKIAGDGYDLYSLIGQILNINQSLCLASNEEKTRFSSLLSLENLVEFIKENTTKEENVLRYLAGETGNESKERNNLLKLINIFIYILNDEHPEIRSYAVKIFIEFNSFVNLISLSKHQIHSCKNFLYNSEFIFKKILRFEQYFESKRIEQFKTNFLNKIKLEFLENFYNDNFYFSKSRSLLNHNNKIFYYEPDNRYLDNIEINTALIKQVRKIEKNDPDSYLKFEELLRKEKNEHEKKIRNVKVMDMLENFIFYFTDNFESIYFKLQEFSANDLDNLFSGYRKIIY